MDSPSSRGTSGEIAVTGGRNPYLPLLRYRTGDFASMEYPGEKDGTPRLVGLQAREAVRLQAVNGDWVHPIEIGRVIRKYVFIQHSMTQLANGSIEMRVRPAAGIPLDTRNLRRELLTIFGEGQALDIVEDNNLGMDTRGGKVISFRSEIPARI